MSKGERNRIKRRAEKLVALDHGGLGPEFAKYILDKQFRSSWSTDPKFRAAMRKATSELRPRDWDPETQSWKPELTETEFKLDRRDK